MVVRVLCAVGAWHIFRAVGLLLRVAYSVLCPIPVARGQALLRGLFCVRPRSVVWCVFCAQMGSCCSDVFLLRSGPCCVARIPGAVGVGGVACSVFRLRVFLFVMRWIVPLCLILTEFFPPFPERVPKPCAETSYLRVQCLCLATLGYAILCAGRRGYNT